MSVRSEVWWRKAITRSQKEVEEPQRVQKRQREREERGGGGFVSKKGKHAVEGAENLRQ